MKSSKFLSTITYDYKKHTNPEKDFGESQTVQGDSYTVRQLFERHMAGSLPNLANEAYYMEEQDFNSIDFDKLKHADIYDKAQLLQEVEEKARRTRKAIEEYQKREEEKAKGENSKENATTNSERSEDKQSADDESKEVQGSGKS
jgi:hypothetical protein